MQASNTKFSSDGIRRAKNAKEAGNGRGIIPLCSLRVLRATRNSFANAFTLLELLVVIAIIGLLAAVALPKLKGMLGSNVTVSATRQLLDDTALARSLALSTRSDVYMVFVPPVAFWPPSHLPPQGSPVDARLLGGQYTTYALYAERTVGDQPGRGRPRYLTPWKTLPQGTFIATDKFRYGDNTIFNKQGYSPFQTNAFPFPTATNNTRMMLPYIKFTSHGQLETARDDGGEIIPLARGSIFYPRDANNQVASPYAADIQENPPHNSERFYVSPAGVTNTMWTWVFIDGLTARAEIRRQEIR